MEANEAPEKIYLVEDRQKHEPMEYWYNSTTDDSKIEYTRTDTFIKEACVKLKKLMYDNLMFQGRLHREEVIDNFVEDFKKYMEG